MLFDEFHERSLDADLGLALALDAQEALREDLRLLVMSATLDGARVASLMTGAAQIESEGRAFPVQTRYVGRDPRLRIEDEIARVALDALANENGSILVFLPGQGEITRVAALLAERIRNPTIDIAPLYGAMDARAQDIAVAPAAPGRRKIVLATSIAETSLTILGVRVVIDSGLMRVPRFEPDIGLTRLETVRVSRANADQRRGPRRARRAGRLLSIVGGGGERRPACVRAAGNPQRRSLRLRSRSRGLGRRRSRYAEIPRSPAARRARRGARAADDARRVGRRRAHHRGGPRDLASRAAAAARAHGDRRGARRAAPALAAEIAVALTERGLGGDAVDLTHRLEAFRRDRSPRAEDARRLARNLAGRAHGSGREQVARRRGDARRPCSPPRFRIASP